MSKFYKQIIVLAVIYLAFTVSTIYYFYYLDINNPKKHIEYTQKHLMDIYEYKLDNEDLIVLLDIDNSLDIKSRFVEFVGYSIKDNKQKRIRRPTVPYASTYRKAPYLYKFYNRYKYRFVENSLGKRWGLFLSGNYNYEKITTFMTIHYFPNIHKLTVSTKPFEYLEHIITGDHEIFTDINSTGTLVLRNNGLLINTIENNYPFVFDLGNYDFILQGEPYSPKSYYYTFYIHNIKFIDDDTVIMLLCHKKPDNQFMIIYSMNDYSKTKIIEINKYFHEGIGQMQLTHWHYPLEVSFCKSKAAFQTVQIDAGEFFLSTIDLNTYDIEQIVSFGSERCNYFKYNNARKNLIAAANLDDIRIVDVEKKQIIKTLPDTYPRSIRWSPDGRKLGILSIADSYSRLSSSQREMQVPSLLIYDLESDTLEKIDEDEDFFDFFWVNRHDPKTEFFMKIEEAKYYIVTYTFVFILITILLLNKRRQNKGQREKIKNGRDKSLTEGIFEASFNEDNENNIESSQKESSSEDNESNSESSQKEGGSEIESNDKN